MGEKNIVYLSKNQTDIICDAGVSLAGLRIICEALEAYISTTDEDLSVDYFNDVFRAIGYMAGKMNDDLMSFFLSDCQTLPGKEREAG